MKLNFKFEGKQGKQKKQAAEIVLQNIRLLAFNNQLLGTQAVTGRNLPERELKSIDLDYVDVTFELNPEQAIKIVLAEKPWRFKFVITRSRQWFSKAVYSALARSKYQITTTLKNIQSQAQLFIRGLNNE